MNGLNGSTGRSIRFISLEPQFLEEVLSFGGLWLWLGLRFYAQFELGLGFAHPLDDDLEIGVGQLEWIAIEEFREFIAHGVISMPRSWIVGTFWAAPSSIRRM